MVNLNKDFAVNFYYTQLYLMDQIYERIVRDLPNLVYLYCPFLTLTIISFLIDHHIIGQIAITLYLSYHNLFFGISLYNTFSCFIIDRITERLTPLSIRHFCRGCYSCLLIIVPRIVKEKDIPPHNHDFGRLNLDQKEIHRLMDQLFSLYHLSLVTGFQQLTFNA